MPIQKKATEQFFPVVLLITLYKEILPFEFVDGILKVDMQMKATERFFPTVLFTMPYKGCLPFESADKRLKWNN